MKIRGLTRTRWFVAGLAAGAALTGILAPQAHADGTFVMCPDGREGVIGDNTTCAFAENVRKTFYLQEMPRDFTTWSPVTGQAYQMDCGGIIPAHFADGETLKAIRCYGGDGAEVVIW